MGSLDAPIHRTDQCESERGTVGRRLGAYVIYDEIGAGGMASVYLGRTRGSEGMSRTVAVKSLHPHLARDADLASLLVDEARMAMRVRHANVVSILDVVEDDGSIALVLELVSGVTLATLLRQARAQKKALPPSIASAMLGDVLAGLHAAHEATDLRGERLGLVHRDVSPQNILVGSEGVARLIDFGVAKARGRLQTTTRGEIKGKLAYMAPEQLACEAISSRTDVYAAGVVLWETLTRRRLFSGEDGAVVAQVMAGMVEPPSHHAPALPAALDDVVERAIAADPSRRFATAREMAVALHAAVSPASQAMVGEWVADVAASELAERAALVAAVERRDAAATDVRADASNARTRSEMRSVRRPRARSRWTVAAIVLGMAGVGAVASARHIRAPANASGGPRAELTVARPTLVTASRLEMPAASADPPERADAPAPSALPSAQVRSEHAAGRVGAPRAHSPRGDVEDCSVPYTIDAQRRRIYKRACL